MIRFIGALALLLVALSVGGAQAAPEKIIIDTDIGDDIDDAFAVALALRSPEFQILGITTGYGDTVGRAKILDRMLGEAGRSDIPVAIGVPTKPDLVNGNGLTQHRYGDGGAFAKVAHPKAVDFILEQIRRYPGQITLVAVAPLSNIGALIDRDAATFAKLKRVVMMGGSIAPMTDAYGNARPVAAEWNIKSDIPAAQKLFRSGVPIVEMPLDSTAGLKLEEVRRDLIFGQGTPLTDALALLYHQWVLGTRGQVTPTLFDPMTLVYLLAPSLCPVTPMHVRVDDQGFTRREAGAANAQVCLHADPDAVLGFITHRLLTAR